MGIDSIEHHIESAYKLFSFTICYGNKSYKMSKTMSDAIN
jgi:hypothetical protein